MKKLLALILALSMAVPAWAGTISRPTKTFGGTTFVNGVTPDASDFNGDIDTIYGEFNGSISNANVSGSAAIAGSKISPAFTATVSTVGGAPCFYLDESDQAPDQKRWYACGTSGALTVETRNDAGALQNTWLSIARATGGMTWSGAGPHAIGGNTTPRAAFRGTGLGWAGSGDGENQWMRLDPTLSPVANDSSFIAWMGGNIQEAVSGTHVDFVTLLLSPVNITPSTADTTNASTLKITAAPTGATNNYALWVAGGNVRAVSAIGSSVTPNSLGPTMDLRASTVLDFLSGTVSTRWFDSTGSTVRMTLTDGGSWTLSTTGPHAIGGAASSLFQILQTGSFSGSAAYRLDTTITPGLNASGYGFNFNPTLVEHSSGTHPQMVGLSLFMTITPGTAATTDAALLFVDTFAAPTGTINASGVKINGAPTGASNNYAAWIKGQQRWDADTIVINNSSSVEAGRIIPNIAGNLSFRPGAASTGNVIIQSFGGSELLRVTDGGSLSVSTAGPHAIGGNVNTRYGVAIGGVGDAVFTGAAGGEISYFIVRPISVSSPSGTFDIYNALIEGSSLNPAGASTTGASLRINSPSKGGAGSFINMATVLIGSAPTGGTNNYAAWVAAGHVRLDGALGLNSTSGLGAIGGNDLIFTTSPNIDFTSLTERMRLTNGGILALGTTVTTSAVAGNLVVPNNSSIRGVNSTATDTLQIIRLNTNNQIEFGAQDVKWGVALVALGGGSTATLGTIGGAGPAAAGQNTWMRVIDSTGAAFWVPAWK